MYKKLKLVESVSDRYQVREFDGPGAKFGVYDTKTKKFVQKGSKKVMTAACEDLNKKNKKLKEGSMKEYRYITTHGIGPGTVPKGAFIRSEDLDNYKTAIYLNRPLTSEELKKYDIKPEWIQESAKLTEADDDLDDLKDKAEEDLENKEELEDTVDSEEDQEENPVEEESELDKQLNELRDILIDLDLNLYQITDKEDLNNSIYVIGKVADESNDILMLVDTQPEEVNSEEIPEEPIMDKIDTDDNKLDEVDNNIYKDEDEAEYYRNKELYANSNLAKHREAMEKAAKACKEKGIKLKESEEIKVSEEPEEDNETELEQRFDFVKLPNTFEEINKLNPRYGEELTPDHEAIVEYLMNCLIEMNPEAAEELQKEDNEETPIEPEEDIDLDIDIDGEEDLEDED